MLPSPPTTPAPANPRFSGGLKDKRVVARVDFNVPISKKDGVTITNTQRIDAAIPTIACACPPLSLHPMADGHTHTQLTPP
jgi:hypothetical protein